METHSAARVLIGHCPDCGAVLVVFNNFESWPLVHCRKCPWQGGTTQLANWVRYDAGWTTVDLDENGDDRHVIHQPERNR